MTKSLILAGGCFWCVEHDMREAPGVTAVTSGYSGGETTNPTYENHKGHKEVILVEYDESKILYKKLLQFFIDHIDPTDVSGQFADRGDSYKSGIFYENDEERKESEYFIDIVNNSKRWKNPVVTTLEPLQIFYPAEEYHQDYLQNNPSGYTCHALYFDSYLK